MDLLLHAIAKRSVAVAVHVLTFLVHPGAIEEYVIARAI